MNFLKNIITLVLFLTPAIIFAQENTFILKGHVEHFSNGKVILTSKDGNILDSTKTVNGNFTFKGKLQNPVYAYLRIGDNLQQVSFFLESKNMRVELNKDSLQNAVFSGSPETNSWEDYRKVFHKISMRAGPYYHLVDSLNKASNGKLDSSDKAISKAALDKLQDYDMKMHKQYVLQHKNSVVCPFIIIDHFVNYFEFKQAEELFALVTPAIKNSFYGKKLSDAIKIANRTAIGTSPTFSQIDSAGKVMNLQDFRGQYVLVDFWASWCGPCRRENPNVLAAYKKYHPLGFTVVGVSLDNNKKAWLNAVHHDNLEWTQLCDLKGWENEAAVKFGVKVVPTNFLLDKNGKIIAKNLRGEDLQNKLKDLLK